MAAALCCTALFGTSEYTALVTGQLLATKWWLEKYWWLENTSGWKNTGG
jgi:hypothetical protein